MGQPGAARSYLLPLVGADTYELEVPFPWGIVRYGEIGPTCVAAAREALTEIGIATPV